MHDLSQLRNMNSSNNHCSVTFNNTACGYGVRVQPNAHIVVRKCESDLSLLPCANYTNWNYAQDCYGYYANTENVGGGGGGDACYLSACQYVNFIDVEDFMNNEKRKEKSRDAARCRRSKETEIFSDLSGALPVTQEQVAQLDKASIMRLAISYLKVRDMIKLVPETCGGGGSMAAEEEIECKQYEIQKAAATEATESVFLKSIDGFVLVLSIEGEFVYVSENIADYLGITQIDLMGQNIYDYSHPCDHDEIKEMLSIKDREKFVSEDTKSFFLRLKCTLTSKGRSVNLKSATYKVIHCTGHMLHVTEDTLALESNSKLEHCMVAIGQPIAHPSNIEAPLPHQTFFTKHALDMKFTYADEKMLEFLGYNAEDLIGKSVYEYHHATDMDVISSAYKSLFAKGQCETNRYRFLAKNGGYVWVLTQATLIYDKVQKPESVVCVNFIISGIECKEEIYAAFQLESTTTNTAINPLTPGSPSTPQSVILDEINNNNSETFVVVDEKEFVQLAHLEEDNTQEAAEAEEAVAEDEEDTSGNLLFVNNNNDESNNCNRPQTATSKIFAPRTEEMSKGFLTFSDEEPGLTLLKDEPDDLTHLAPVAGDVVSLETHPFLNDMLDDLLLKDAFCPLLADSVQDPLIAYGSSRSEASPNILKSSECSLPSLNSPSDSLISEEDQQMTTFMTFPTMEEDPELVMKAPYISMAMGDDLPLLNSEDLMWSNGLDISPPAACSKKNFVPENSSSLAELLSSGVNKYPIKDTRKSNIYNERRGANTNGKRNCTSYDVSSKRLKSEPSELLQHLIGGGSGNSNSASQRTKRGGNWLLDTGGKKAHCVSQPSESVLMNLLEPDPAINHHPQQSLLKSPTSLLDIDLSQQDVVYPRSFTRKSSISLLDPEALGIPSLLDLTQQDYEVNAPVSNFLLHGDDLITALNNDTLVASM